jgi:hypothetical protein
VLAVPVAVVEAVLYPLTALLTVIVEDCADVKPDAVIAPVEELTVPDPAVADTYEYVAPDCVPAFTEAVQPPDADVAVPYENATASALAEVI